MTEYMTKEMLNELKQELDNLINVKRPEILERLKKARSFGDLSENAEYTETKKEQSRNERRIMELELKIKNGRLIDESDKKGSISIGSIVVIEDINTNEEFEYQIVSESVADIEKGRISDTSLIGKELMGKKVGESIVLRTSLGETRYTVKSIT